MSLPQWLRASRRGLQVQRLRELVEQNDQRTPNGTLYKRFWTLYFDPFFNDYIWSLNQIDYPNSNEEVLAFAEIGVNGR